MSAEDDLQRHVQAELVDGFRHEPIVSDLDPHSVRCDVCGAEPGSPCRRPSGHNVFGHGVHAIRRSDAERATRKDP